MAKLTRSGSNAEFLALSWSQNIAAPDAKVSYIDVAVDPFKPGMGIADISVPSVTSEYTLETGDGPVTIRGRLVAHGDMKFIPGSLVHQTFKVTHRGWFVGQPMSSLVLRKVTSDPYWHSADWEDLECHLKNSSHTNTRVTYRTQRFVESRVVDLECGHRHFLGGPHIIRKNGKATCTECTYPK